MFTGTFPPTTNRADWTVSYELTDSQSGELFDLSDVTDINLVVRDPDSKRIVLTGSKSGGEIILTDGDPSTITMTIASPAVVTWAGSNRKVDDIVIFETGGALPTGATAGAVYYVIAAGLTADSFEFSATLGGAAVNTSGTQSGTHTAEVGQVGLFQWTFAAASMRALCAKTYDVGATLTHADGAVTQIILASLPVIDGITA